MVLELPANFTLLAGPQLVAIFLAWGLQGALVVQCYIYQTCFPNDRISFKLLVWGVFIWEWVQLGLVTQTYFDIYVYNYGSIASLTSYHSTWFSVPIMSAVVSFAVQCFFAWRIWVLSLSRLLTGIIIFFSFAQAALEVAGGIIIRLTDANAAHASLNRPIVSTSLIVATVVDVLIAASMTYLLLRAKTGMKQSDAIIHKLARVGIETGAATAAVAFIYAVFFMTHQNDLLFECPALVLPKLYANTLLVSLNNRAFTFRGGLTTMGGVDSEVSSTPMGRSRALVSQELPSPTASRPVHINVHQETYTAHDTAKDSVELVPMEHAFRSRGFGEKTA
ncbi:hypothetical protein K466DRAFT_605580 [Polyporus arcularius HHB13444]|uniref:DUF6534 domain-containing protein n=1 Tax=Polyporus arcularius HHB13444 TaxID=1314778 RepID=A0A5C3NVW6_9APHY|nr:hypothetical protein K466DRAFT_605580 [Polyporus arcularius HHB13444]